MGPFNVSAEFMTVSPLFNRSSCLRRPLVRSFFLLRSFWELRPPVSLQMLVHGETLDFTSDLLRGRPFAPLVLAGGTPRSTFTTGTVSGI
jgi:hypothetical protein